MISRAWFFWPALALLAGFGASRIAEGNAPTTRLVAGASAQTLLETSAKLPEGPYESSLRGQFDLKSLRLDGDQYWATLPKGGKAALTLHPGLQKAALNVLAQAKAPTGAVVVVAKDGRILALAGARSSGKNSEPDYSLATATWAPAASIFKIVTAGALLAKGVSPSAKTCFHGGLRSVDESNLRDIPKLDHQCETLGFAVAESQNAIIAKLAVRHLTPATLNDVAGQLAWTTKPDFALVADQGMVAMPSEPIEFGRAAAGFRSSELSPLGGALLAATIATGGKRVSPSIVSEIVDSSGSRLRPKRDKASQVFPSNLAGTLGEMMRATTITGTARKGFFDARGRRFLSVDVAGKTGSLSKNDPRYVSYSWFVGYAPADKPEVAIAVLLGNSETWHLKAHTAARLVLDVLY